MPRGFRGRVGGVKPERAGMRLAAFVLYSPPMPRGFQERRQWTRTVMAHPGSFNCIGQVADYCDAWCE
eukprot:5059590-Pyramimonas_sp.AAC.1